MRLGTYLVITYPTEIRYNGEDLEEACKRFRNLCRAGYEVELWENERIVAYTDQVYTYARYLHLNTLFN